MEAFKLKSNKSEYLVLEEIGRGGMGVIFRAKDLGTEQILVVKKAGLEPLIDEEQRLQIREQQQHQLKALGPLDHPTVAKIYDQFSDEGHEYLAMEYIQGPTLMEVLENVLAQGRLLDESRVLGWALQVLNALAYLHRQPKPIIHRDIKPHNLMLNRDGRIILVDFGLMKQSDRRFTEETGALIRAVGTVEYAPPEQYADSGTRTSIHTDIYSLGATLYHLLAGRLPPRAVDRVMPVSIVSDITKRPPSLCKINPTVCQRTEQIIFKAIEVDPEERYQSAYQMHEDFYPRHHVVRLPSFRRKDEDAISVVLLIATFQDNENKANEVLQQLKQLKKEKVFNFDDVAAIAKTKAGEIEVQNVGDVDAKQGAIFGAITGSVVGLLGGPVGAVAGAIAGAATGGITAGKADYGVSNDLIREVKEGLHPGDSAIIAYADPIWVDKIVDYLEKEGATVIQDTLRSELITNFRRGTGTGAGYFAHPSSKRGPST